MTAKTRNMSASVLARLLTKSRETGQTHQLLLQRYVSERFLRRLGKSRHRQALVLKGASLFAMWGGPLYRPTRDLDFTAYGAQGTQEVSQQIREICAIEDDDGVTFDASTVEPVAIRDDDDHGGIRTRFIARVGSAVVVMQVDVGFGNAIHPGPVESDFPTLLKDSAAPTLFSYPREAVVAEKLHAMVALGERNSRYKDFYDLYVLAASFSFDGADLSAAVAATFERRKTAVTADIPVALTPAFFADAPRAGSWRAYLRKNSLPGAPEDFEQVYAQLSRFLAPLWSALAARSAFGESWPPGGPWEAK